jgi:transposase
LHVHYSVVGRVLAQAGLPRPGPPPRKSRIDPYLAFIRQTLETFPALTASRLYVMVRERGYRGSPDHFRHLIACHRPRPKAEAYLRLRSLPGEQGQSLPPRKRGSIGDILAISRSAARGVH